MKIQFYFDPCCPFCWITSRWLHEVKQARALHIEWIPFSLAMKNNEDVSELQTTEPNQIISPHLAAHKVLRIMYVAQQQEQASMETMYSAFGKHYHVNEGSFSNDEIITLLTELRLPTALLAEAKNNIHDKALESCIEAAVNIVGDDIGVPTIVFEHQNGKKSGFFGPVLQSLPTPKESLALWDGLTMVASSKTFYELKRSRPHEKPDVFSTSK